MTLHRLILPILIISIVGCASRPAIINIPGASKVKVGKSDPADNYSDIGPITASDGHGCGLFGRRGTYNGAVLKLKNLAAGFGGNYVQIFTLKEPHSRGGCFDNTYTISGSIFKKTSDSPNPIPIIQKSNRSNSDKLRELKSLLDEKIITNEEFNAQKKKILESGI
jgi:hypothetical protein